MALKRFSASSSVAKSSVVFWSSASLDASFLSSSISSGSSSSGSGSGPGSGSSSGSGVLSLVRDFLAALLPDVLLVGTTSHPLSELGSDLLLLFLDNFFNSDLDFFASLEEGLDFLVGSGLGFGLDSALDLTFDERLDFLAGGSSSSSTSSSTFDLLIFLGFGAGGSSSSFSPSTSMLCFDFFPFLGFSGGDLESFDAILTSSPLSMKSSSSSFSTTELDFLRIL
mmetsp:Transcript_28214/g.44930  ORF Transcript_28214/g.44930 Transcript_28214/m.44930 type:complete len:225 (-) Transcript_28214:121-795(-)